MKASSLTSPSRTNGDIAVYQKISHFDSSRIVSHLFTVTGVLGVAFFVPTAIQSNFYCC